MAGAEKEWDRDDEHTLAKHWYKRAREGELSEIDQAVEDEKKKGENYLRDTETRERELIDLEAQAALDSFKAGQWGQSVGEPVDAGPSIAQQIIDSGPQALATVQDAAAAMEMDGGVGDAGVQNSPVINIYNDGGAGRADGGISTGQADGGVSTSYEESDLELPKDLLREATYDGPSKFKQQAEAQEAYAKQQEWAGKQDQDAFVDSIRYPPAKWLEQAASATAKEFSDWEPFKDPVQSYAPPTGGEALDTANAPFDLSREKEQDPTLEEYGLLPDQDGQIDTEDFSEQPKPKKKRARRPTRESVGEPEIKKETVAEAVVQSVKFPDREPWFATTATALMEANPMFAHVIPSAINKVALDFYGNALREMSEGQKADDDSYLKLMNSILRHSQAKDLKAQEIQGYLDRSRKRKAADVGHDWAKGKLTLSAVGDYLMTLDRPMQSNIIDLYNANLDTDELYGDMLEKTWTAAATLLTDKGAKGAHADPDEIQAAKLQLGFDEHEKLNDKQIEKAVQTIVATATDNAISIQRAVGIGSDRSPTYIGQYNAAQNAMLQALVLAAQKEKRVREFIADSGTDTKKSMQNIVSNIMKMKKVHPQSRGRVRKAKKNKWQK